MTAARPKRVLVVDDEAGLRETLADILECGGWDVCTAGDGLAALEALKENNVDVVLMDIQMPRCDGITALQAISPAPPVVIMMTAYAIDERLQAAVDAEAFAILHKPFPVDRMLSIVNSIPATAA